MKFTDAMLVLENPLIRSASKLRAAAEALLARDLVTYENDVRRLMARAKDSENKAR